MTRLFLLFFFMVSGWQGFSQDSIAARYDRYERIAYIKDSAYYFRVGEKNRRKEWEGEVRDYYASGKIAKRVYFKEGKENGSYQTFYENGQKEEIGRYRDGKEDGEWSTFFKNGNLDSKGEYDEGDRVGLWKFYYENGSVSSEGKFEKDRAVGVWKEYFKNGVLNQECEYWTENEETNRRMITMNDSTGLNMVKEGNGYAREYEKDNHYFVEGKYQDGMKKGVWKGKHDKKQLTFMEYYQADTLVSGETTDSTNHKYQYIFVDEIPEYVGGMSELRKFLAKEIKYPAIEREKNIQGKLYIQFHIDTKGDVVRVVIKRWVSPGLDMEGIRVVRLMPKWKVGFVRGVPTERRYVLPINFKIN